MPWNCPWSTEARPRRHRRAPAPNPAATTAADISGPLHLLLLKEGVGQQHAFRSKAYRKARPCHWCHQPVLGQGLCCRVCKYVCHAACENKIPEAHEIRDQRKNAELTMQSKAADAARFSDTSWQIHRTWSRDGSATPATPPPHLRHPPHSATPPAAPAAANAHKDSNGIYDTILPRAVSAPAAPAAYRNHNGGARLPAAGAGAGAAGGRLDLCYVAERMLALYLPGRDAQAEAQAAHMLSTKHAHHFMVFEVSGDGGGEGGGAGGAARVFGRARSLGWGGELAPPLERLCAACKQLDRWLAADPRNVAVLLAWESRERLGVIVAAYMHYSSICGAAEHALDRYAMRRYLDDRVPVFRLPSNKRYIDTFAGLLAGQIRVNAAPLQLTHVSVAGAPPQPSHAFLKIYENLNCVYTSGVYVVGGGGSWTVGVGRLTLRGDVLVRAYRRLSAPAPAPVPTAADPAARQLVFACQFHTCAVADHTLSFTKHQLDYAAHDPMFPTDGAVELVFTRGGGVAGGAPPAPTPAATLRAPPDALARHDSLEHLRPRPLSDLTDDEPGEGRSAAGSGGSAAGEGEAAHTFGPLDGSIYATVVRGSAGSGGAGGGGGPPASPLSASMDSGISSAGRRAAPSPPDELDALLGDMLRTVSALPDAVPQSRTARPPDIPYHARTDSAPFTYGAPGLQPGMLRASNRLASPELVRRALSPPASSAASRRLPITDDEEERAESPRELTPPRRSRSASTPAAPLPASPPLHSPLTRKKFTHEDLTTTTTTSSLAPSSPLTPLTPRTPLHNGRWQNGDSDWLDKPLWNGRKSEEGWRSDGGWDTMRIRETSATAGSGGAGLTWLQRQQQKLRERREACARGVRLPHDWGTGRHVRHSASHRVDGYTSDTTAFADDDEDFSVPLHVHTSGSARAHAASHALHAQHTPHADSVSPAAPDRSSSKKFMFSEKMLMREWSSSTTGSAPAHPGLLSLAEPLATDTLSRERSASWSRAPLDSPRAATPAFPTHPRTPYPPTPTPSLGSRPPRSPPVMRRERGSSPEAEYRTLNGSLSGASRRSSLTGEPQDVAPEQVRFARDTSHYWYKPNISRDEAISVLSKCAEGAFIVRDSNSFPGAFGLAVRAAGAGAGAVRHFLVEPTARGVRLRGCPDEPVFSSLSALVYQHTVTRLALPTRLRLPDRDLWPGGGGNAMAAARALLATGAACHVLLLGSDNTEALTGPAAVRRAVTRVLQKKGAAHVVHFKVFGGGVTLTDAARKLFFRRHYPAAAVSYAGLDPDDRRYEHTDNGASAPKRIFAFVARAQGSDNQCHVFAELEPEQPATAIVNFVNKALLGNTQKRDIL